MWVVDLELAAFHIGITLDEEQAIKAFDGRVVQIERNRWWITKFVGFQFGELSTGSRLHQSVTALIHRHGLDTLSYEYANPKHTPQVKVQVQVQEKVKASEEEGTGEKPKPRPGGIPRNEREAIEWASMDAVPADFAKTVFQQCEGVGWIDGSQRPIVNWRSYAASRYSRSKTTGSGTNGRPLSIMDLNQVIKIKEEKAAAIKEQYSTQGPLSVDWRDADKRKEWIVLRKEIKSLKSQIEARV